VCKGSIISHPFRLSVGRDTDDCHVHRTAKLGCKIDGSRGGGDSEATRLGANFTERDVKKFPGGQYLAKLGAHSHSLPVSNCGKSGLQGDGPGKEKLQRRCAIHSSRPAGHSIYFSFVLVTTKGVSP
jgi:hypothetical protein